MINRNNYPASLHKTASFTPLDALILMNPFATAAGSSPNTPIRLAKDPRVNQAIWNALFAGGGMLATGALIKHLSARKQDEKFDKKQREAIESKVTGIMPSESGEKSDKDQVADNERRNRKEPAASANGTVKKKANSPVSGIVKSTLLGMVPVAAAGGGLYLGAKMLSDDKKTEREEQLKKEIAQLSTKLDKLYNDRLMLNEKRRALKKSASDDDDIGMMAGLKNFLFGTEDPYSDNRSAFKKMVSWPFITAGITGLLSTYAAKRYFDKRDADRAKLKMLEKKMLPADLVGTPPVIIMEEGPRGKLQVAGRREEVKPKEDEKEKDKEKASDADPKKPQQQVPPADVMAALGLK